MTATTWWGDRRRRDRTAVMAFAAVALLGILIGAFVQFAKGDTRVLVATMVQDIGQQARQNVQNDCGHLPGISVVPDQGNPSPQVQGRFPVRFNMRGASAAQEAALEACLNRHQDVVRGFLAEGDAG